jgi:hypothetical protein
VQFFKPVALQQFQLAHGHLQGRGQQAYVHAAAFTGRSQQRTGRRLT